MLAFKLQDTSESSAVVADQARREPVDSVPDIFTCPDCWAELDLRAIRRGSLRRCPKCDRPLQRERSQRRWLSFEVLFVGGLVAIGVAVAILMTCYMLPLIKEDDDQSKKSKPE